MAQTLDYSSNNVTPADAAGILTRGNRTLATKFGEAATVTYSFVTTQGAIGDPNAFTPAQIAATKAALALWSDVANINFVSVTGVNSPYTDGSKSTLDFKNYFNAADSASGRSWGTGFGFNLGNMNGVNDSQATARGQTGFHTLVHEIGHLLGLEHPGGYDAPVDDPATTNVDESLTAITYAANKGYIQDSHQYSVMSYFGPWETTGDFVGVSPSTPMLHDIAAAQRIYGANLNTRSGDTVYGFNSSPNALAYAITDNAHKVAFTIWDAKGTDTLDLSQYTDDQVINLNPGTFSNAGGLKNNIAMSEAVDATGKLAGTAGFNAATIVNYIENAYGGSGKDVIWGNAAVNFLTGGAGNDELYGGGGNDILNGGANNDLLDGNQGADTMDGGSGDDHYRVDNAGDKVFESAGATGGADTVFTTLASYNLTSAANVENLVYYGPGKFTGTGNTLSNIIVGAGGNDTLSGGAGNDELFGGSGNDRLEGGANNDTLRGEAGSDTMIGGSGDDTYVADASDILVEAADSVVMLNGKLVWISNGIDTVYTDAKSWTLGATFEHLNLTGDFGHNGTGNAYDNVIRGAGAIDFLYGREGDDTLAGGGGNDRLMGGVDNDTLYGEANDDFLYGEDGVDQLYGGAGNDTLFGGLMNDSLDGGDNIDTAVFTGNRAGYGLQHGTGDRAGWIAITNLATGEVDWMLSVESMRFDDGTVKTGDLLATVVGTEIAETLVGTEKMDLISGLGGNDTLNGGAGNDTLNGGEGNDTVWGEAGVDTLNGGGGNDVLFGGAGVDTLDGGAGEDILVTDNFDVDIIQGGDGFDQVYASDLTIVTGFKFKMTAAMNIEGISGNHGNDVLDASVATKSVYLVGFYGDDVITGGGGDDYIVGDAYDFSPAGNDIMHGGGGSDNMYGYNGDDIMYGDGGITSGLGDRMWGGSGNDTLYGGGNGYVLGEDGNDTLTGADMDLVMGGAGNDTVLGAAGFQQIVGGAGNDRLSGGAGGDRFDVANGWGRDVITDFKAPEGDKIGMFDVTGLDTFSQLNVVNSGDGADVSFGADVIHLTGVAAAQVQSDWFIL